MPLLPGKENVGKNIQEMIRAGHPAAQAKAAAMDKAGLSYKKKKKTRGMVAREKGLEPLAEIIRAEDEATPPRRGWWSR